MGQSAHSAAEPPAPLSFLCKHAACCDKLIIGKMRERRRLAQPVEADSPARAGGQEHGCGNAAKLGAANGNRPALLVPCRSLTAVSGDPARKARSPVIDGGEFSCFRANTAASQAGGTTWLEDRPREVAALRCGTDSGYSSKSPGRRLSDTEAPLMSRPQ
jgi:hypothetical protein